MDIHVESVFCKSSSIIFFLGWNNIALSKWVNDYQHVQSCSLNVCLKIYAFPQRLVYRIFKEIYNKALRFKIVCKLQWS